MMDLNSSYSIDGRMDANDRDARGKDTVNKDIGLN